MEGVVGVSHTKIMVFTKSARVQGRGAKNKTMDQITYEMSLLSLFVMVKAFNICFHQTLVIENFSKSIVYAIMNVV